MFLIHEGLIEPVKLGYRAYGIAGYDEYDSIFSGRILLRVVRTGFIKQTLGVRLE